MPMTAPMIPPVTGPIAPQPGILQIAPYKGGASSIAGRADAVKLSSNENPFGPSLAAMAALRDAAGALHVYPSSDQMVLREALGVRFGLDPARIVCGAGSGEILMTLAQAYAGPGDTVIYPEHGFSMYPIYAHAVGAEPITVPEQDRVVDVDAILAAADGRTRLVLLANPANPTGTMVEIAALERLAEGLPEQALLVLDGAYAEYVPGYDGGAALVERRQNVVMTRTFSKLFALGGLRVGWGYAPAHVIDVLYRLRGPFNLGSPQIAAATAALADHAHGAHTLAETTRLRGWLADELAGLGVPSDPSFANFLLARFGSPAEAQACDAALKSEGLIVRQVAGYGLPHCLRITIGDASACARVVEAVARFRDAPAAEAVSA